MSDKRNNLRQIKNVQNYFAFNIADKAHNNIKAHDKKRPEQLIMELTESDEY